MLVTHLFQVAAEVAMEPPVDLSPASLQEARESVLAAFRPLAKEDVVLGQFEGYTDIEGVPDDSTTDTFVAARLWVDTDRWHGVPFLLRTGKKLAASEQKVSLVLRKPDGPVTPVPEHGNVITLSLSGAAAPSTWTSWPRSPAHARADPDPHHARPGRHRRRHPAAALRLAHPRRRHR